MFEYSVIGNIASVEIDEDKHVFVCPYCGSVYAIGTLNINDRR